MQRLVAISFVWLGCAFAWAVLGSTLVARSGQSSTDLDHEVQRLWGPPLVQMPPRATYDEVRTEQETVTSHQIGRPVTSLVEREVRHAVPANLAASDIQVALEMEHRRKGLLWFPTYTVDFVGVYVFENPTAASHDLRMTFPLDANSLVYDGFHVVDAEGGSVEAVFDGGHASWTSNFAPGERRAYEIRYQSRGIRSWHYGSPAGGLAQGQGRVRDFRLEMATGFTGIDFPAGSLSPTTHGPDGDGWRGAWRFDTLITGSAIGVTLPQRLNPGPLASKITFFAPLSLLFFFFVVAVLALARGKNLHPMHFFFLGCAFFAFHLLFAYLVDHVSIGGAFATASVVSIALVVTYARLFVGWRFALVEMGLSQLVYLVLFSFTFFWAGFTGLAVTLGAVATLFLMMQMTGRLDWSRVREAVPAPEAG